MGLSTGTRSPEAARQLARAVARSGRHSTVQLPIALVRTQSVEVVKPPLSLLLSGGRGGEVRLKLYLTLCLLATKEPYDIRSAIPARAWAEALGLADPDGAGARRVNAALRWLHKQGFVRLESRRGHPPSIQLLDVDPLGSSETYRGRGGPRYLTLPLGLWSEQWIVVMSGSALALLLILLELQGGKRTATHVPTGRREQYGLSDDTWTRATAELRDLGLLSVGRVIQGEGFDFRRRRNSYWVTKERLEEPPGF